MSATPLQFGSMPTQDQSQALLPRQPDSQHGPAQPGVQFGQWEATPAPVLQPGLAPPPAGMGWVPLAVHAMPPQPNMPPMFSPPQQPGMTWPQPGMLGPHPLPYHTSMQPGFGFAPPLPLPASWQHPRPGNMPSQPATMPRPDSAWFPRPHHTQHAPQPALHRSPQRISQPAGQHAQRSLAQHDAPRGPQHSPSSQHSRQSTPPSTPSHPTATTGLPGPSPGPSPAHPQPAAAAAAPRPPPRLSRPNFVAQQISAAVSRIQGLFPALPHPLVVVALQALLQSVITLPPPHFSSATDMQAGLDEVLRKSGPAKPLQLQWLHNALAPGLEDYIVGVVMAACAWLVQVYLAGESLPTFGGNLVRSHGQPAERPGKALGHLPNASRQELEGALQACLLNPELMQPAKVEAARLPPPLLPPPLGSRCALPEELAMWRAASGLPRLHAEALKDMMWLVRDEGGLSVGPEVDFGVRRIVPSHAGAAEEVASASRNAQNWHPARAHAAARTGNDAFDRETSSWRNGYPHYPPSTHSPEHELPGDAGGHPETEPVDPLADLLIRLQQPAGSARPNAASDKGPAQALPPGRASQQHSRGAYEEEGQRLYVRELLAVNQAPADALLIDIRAVPAREHTFALVDDLGLARHRHVPGRQGAAPPPPAAGVRLKSGDHYPVAVLLDCSDGNDHGAEAGLLQQVVLFTFAVRRAIDSQWLAAQAILGFPVPSAACREAVGEYTVLVIGRRVTVALTRHVAELQRMLNIDAKPFVAAHLKSLFDTEPTLYHPQTPPLAALIPDRALLCSLVRGWPQHSANLASHNQPTREADYTPPAAARQQAAWLRTRVPVAGAAAAVAARLRRLARLIALEEAAMEHDIKRYDMFNVRLKYAVFTKGGRQYRIHSTYPPLPDTAAPSAAGKAGPARSPSADPATTASAVGSGAIGSPLMSAAGTARPAGSERRHVYRGPSLSVLFPEGLRREGSPLVVLEVPGLPEARPKLVFGDTVYLRMAARPGIEYAATMVVTNSTRALLALPSIFWDPSRDPRDSAADTVDHWPALPSRQTSPQHNAGRTAAPVQGRSEPAGGSAAAVGAGDGSRGDQEDQGVIHGSELVHMRFSFDRTLLLRMHAALSASVRADVALLPDDEASKQIIARLPKAADVDAVASSIRELGAQTLNQEQRAAVAALLCGAGVAAPYALFGPPGTGKTVTMVECALQILQRQPGAHLLLCAPQSYSADLLCSAMAKAGITSKQMLRLHDPRHPPPQVKQDVLQFSMLDETVRAFALPSAEQVAGYSVIITTCGAAGFVREIMQSHAAGSDGHLGSAGMQLTLDFSHVLIDEAGQALLPEALIPLTLLAQGGSSMLCGDPRQLGPVVRSPVSAANGLAASLLEGFIAQHQQLVPRCTELGLVAPTGMLVRNYRSHSRLLELPSRLFYQGALLAAADPTTVLPPAWDYLRGSERSFRPAGATDRGGDQHGQLAQHEASQAERAQEALAGAGTCQPPAVGNGSAGLHGSSDGDAEYAEGAEHAGDAGDGEFLDDAEDDFEDDFEAQLPTSTLFFGVRGQQMREGEAPSYFNPLEAAALVDLLAGLLAPRPGVGGVSEDDIGVIATYRKQAQKIRALLRERGHGKVRVGTVDDYQGQEERIIFISTVLSRPESLPPQRAKQAQHDGADRPDHDADAMHVGFWRNPKRFNVAITRAKALLVVVGHPIVLMQDDSWRELVRHCAARGAYRGAGAETMAQLVRSDALSVARVPGLDGAFEAGPGEEDGDAELARTVEQIAELALLGVGHADRMFPSTLKEAYNAFGNNELEWRIAL